MRLVSTLILLFALSSHSAAQSGKAETDPELQAFIQQFLSATNHHKADSMMLLMDPGYRLEQHDKFHQGNTKRFLNELFCGGMTDGSGFKCIKIKKVRFIQLASLGQGEKNIPVVFRAWDKKSQIDVILTIAVRTENGVRMFGIVGGVG